MKQSMLSILRRRKIVEEIMDILNCRYDKNQVGLFVWGRIPENIKSCEEYIEEILNKITCLHHSGIYFRRKWRKVYTYLFVRQ